MKHLARVLLTSLVLFFCVAVEASAQVTKRFCITGTSDGRPWTWELSGGVGLPGLRVTAAAVPNGGSAADLARRWADSIRDAQGNPPAFTVTLEEPGPDGRACFTITAPRDFTFKVDGCTITNNPQGCSFNPTVVEVTAATPTATPTATPPVSPSPTPAPPPPQSNIPWLWIGLLLLLVLALVIFFARRRRPTP